MYHSPKLVNGNPKIVNRVVTKSNIGKKNTNVGIVFSPKLVNGNPNIVKLSWIGFKIPMLGFVIVPS